MKTLLATLFLTLSLASATSQTELGDIEVPDVDDILQALSMEDIDKMTSRLDKAIALANYTKALKAELEKSLELQYTYKALRDSCEVRLQAKTIANQQCDSVRRATMASYDIERQGRQDAEESATKWQKGAVIGWVAALVQTMVLIFR